MMESFVAAVLFVCAATRELRTTSMVLLTARP